jgi:hypothetical protein
MRQTVHELRRLGYHRIGVALDGDHDLRTDHNYLAGYLVEEHLTTGSEVVPVLTTPYTDHQAVAKWLTAHKPDAVITGNYHFLDVMRSLGRAVPAIAVGRDGAGRRDRKLCRDRERGRGPVDRHDSPAGTGDSGQSPADSYRGPLARGSHAARFHGLTRGMGASDSTPV